MWKIFRSHSKAYISILVRRFGRRYKLPEIGSGGSQRPVNPDGGHGTGGSGGGGSSIGGGSGNIGGGSIGGGAVTPVTPASKLTDGMKAELQGHWAQQEIAAMVESGIVNGVSADSLGLSQTTTRAEFTALLVRAMGLPQTGYQGEFADVAASDWYAGVFAAAKEKGLVQGSGGNANPNALITREEMACMLVRAYELKTASAGTAGGDNSFTDAADISDWARAAVAQAKELGLLSGMGNGAFAPKENTLREQAIVAVYRLMK